MRNRKALSPVVASIILIAVTVGVSLVCAYWMGALTFSFQGHAPIEKIHFNNDFEGYEARLFVRNVSVLQASASYQGYTVAYRTVWEFDDFLDACIRWNVSFVMTDYKVFEIPTIYYANTSYVVEQYSFWFVKELPDVGKVAVVCPLDLTAYWLGD